ncbi:hypothetical protein F5880DRAFT_1511301 [Lentinula raphanica]|nr:hypothetical protein F5880DRAFT_1511301 [Lentinula raphanica]
MSAFFIIMSFIDDPDSDYARMYLVISDIKSKEALMLVMHSSLLIARTAISLYVDGKIVASLVRAKSGEFDLNIIRWLLVAIPATSTNSWFDLALLYPYASLRNSQEKILIEREYATVILHERKVLRRRWWFGCVEEGIVKWLWGSFGMPLVGSCIRTYGFGDFRTIPSQTIYERNNSVDTYCFMHRPLQFDTLESRAIIAYVTKDTKFHVRVLKGFLIMNPASNLLVPQSSIEGSHVIANWQNQLGDHFLLSFHPKFNVMTLMLC